MSFLNNLDWEIIIPVVGTIVAALVSFYQMKFARPRPRSRLKTDLEILELMGESHEQFPKVKKQIDELIADIYSKPVKLSKEKQWKIRAYQFMFAVFGTGFLFWTFYIVRDGWNWWALLTGYLALGFLINIVYYPVIQKRGEKLQKETRDHHSAQTPSETA